MRSAFVETLTELMRNRNDVILITADMGFSVFEDLQKEFPKRFFNTGVTEQSSVGIAAGLALSGYKVFFYTLAPFATMRCFEQVRVDVAMQKTDVIIVGVGAGFGYGQLGPTHHAIEDIAIMRALPNMTVVCPGDPAEAAAATRALGSMQGPAYLRIGKKGEPQVHTHLSKFALGESITVRDGKDIALIATGNMLATGVAVADLLLKKGVHTRVISMHTVKPLDEVSIKKAVRETRAVFTLEEHSIIGGLGSAVAEIIAESGGSRRFKRFGVQDTFTSFAGSQDYLRGRHGLLPSDISRAILKELL